MATIYSVQTNEDFAKAHTKALFNELQHLLNPEEAALISFTDIKAILKPKNEIYIGIQTIPVHKIVGSEGRFRDFDSHFFPKNTFLRERWKHVDEATYTEITLPPISVYELGGLYFVRDGNHRVSVAKSRGIEFIDAEVATLQSEIKLKPVYTLKSMLKEIIFYEKRVFYSETNFGDITDFWGLDFSSTGQYNVIYNHILTHKYFINKDMPREIAIDDAILSWFNTVYLPIIKVIEKQHVMRHFRRNTKSDLYVWIITYWDELKKKFGKTVQLDAAVHSFKQANRMSAIKRLRNVLQRIVVPRTRN